MSDTPRDQQPDDSGTEPVTGPPGGAPTAADGPARGGATGRVGGRAGTGPAGATRAGGSRAAGSPAGGIGGWWRSLWGGGGSTRRPPGRDPREGALRWSSEPGPAGGAGPENDPALRRRRRWFVAGIAAAAALVVIALCAGTVAVVEFVGDFRGRTDEARDDRRARDGDCLALEERLNRLLPPGVTTTPQARAVAVRDENAAVRIYVAQVPDVPDQDGWRQLLDARTAYAEALDRQAKSRTPAFFVAPRTADGRAVTDQLVRWSPAPCAGPIRRLAAPDL